MAIASTVRPSGALHENVVAQELKAHGLDLHHYKNDAIGELDSVVEYPHGRVTPPEVKSGQSHKRHSAMTRAVATESLGILRGLAFAETNVGPGDRVGCLPISMISQSHRGRSGCQSAWYG